MSSEAGGGGMEGEVEKKEVGSGVVRWERFLPRMVLRVLLVEADDSTRQIIAALLRKCSYKGLFMGFLCLLQVLICVWFLSIVFQNLNWEFGVWGLVIWED